MISCDSFRTRFHANTDDAALLAHLRACDRCLDHAASVDPDVLFRALGGNDMIPPGGVDAFVDDVMRQVRVRGTENNLRAHNVVSWPRRLAVAATIAAGFTGAMLFSGGGAAPELMTPIAVAHHAPAAAAKNFATKPIVETYESQNATIIEVPAEEAGDNVKLVMIFDENLPADL
jgi:lysophospholipase L1-like esterase